MKNFILLFLVSISTVSHAYQCPSISDFTQDKNNVWHLTKTPAAPSDTFWQPITQGPLAPHHHKLNSIDVSLTYGTWPVRVNCYYGMNSNYFIGIGLYIKKDQKPFPLPGSAFEGDIPNDCYASSENCEFDVA